MNNLKRLLIILKLSDYFLFFIINRSEYFFFFLVLLPKVFFPQGVFGDFIPIGDLPSPPPCG